MTNRYFDTGLNGPEDSLGFMLDQEIVTGIQSFRGQFGYFDGAALNPYLPVLEHMVNNGGTLKLVIGANPGDPASKDDLESILSLTGDSDNSSLTLVAYSGALFHPKTIHLVRENGTEVSVVSSANFTRSGLGRNVEAGLILDSAAGESESINQIAAAIDQWATSTDNGIHQIRSAEDIDNLVEHMLAVDPATRRRIKQRQRTDRTTNTGRGTRPVGWVPQAKPNEQDPTDLVDELPEAVGENQNAPAIGEQGELLWQSKPLTQRDLNIPEADGTHKTGSMNLDKGLLDSEIDHRHYFRDSVFSELEWEPASTATVEESFAKFQLVINEIGFGIFDLRIGHTTSTNTRSYEQRNAMTRLSWGPAQSIIAQSELIGSTMSLYHNNSNNSQFIIKIDSDST